MPPPLEILTSENFPVPRAKAYQTLRLINYVESHIANLKIDAEEVENHPREFKSVNMLRHS